MLSKLLAKFRKFRSDRRGNALMIFAFAVIPMVFATGMGIDYSRAARLRTKLNAIADAAALAAVTQPMMNVTDLDEVSDRAETMFNAQAEGLEGLDGTPVVDVDICQPPAKSCPDPDPDHPNARVAKVSYTAKSINAFGGVLNMRSIPISGASTARAVAAPNMDFYLALDTSPSMALPTTTAGIKIMDDAVQCSFACHSNKIQQYVGSSLPSLILDNATFNIVKGDYGTGWIGGNQIQKIDGQGSYIYSNKTSDVDSKCRRDGKDICIYNPDGSYVDSYWYALNKSVRLRVTDERDAIQDLMALAQTYSTQNKRVYHASLYTFDHGTDFKTIMEMPQPSAPSNLAAVAAAATGVNLVTVNDKAGNGRPPNGSSGTEYLFTSYKTMLDEMGKALPEKSGQGSDEPGDTPQAFLFLVTDGMSDENIGTGRTRTAMQDAQVAQCNAIKDRGVRIAILYTEYTAESIKDDEPNQRGLAEAAIPHIAPQLTRCASPGLMYTVKTDESISAALQSLFTKALATARLTQ